MSHRTKTLFSMVLPPFLPMTIVGWAITIDGPTANNIAIACVYAYFEIQRRNDMRKTVAIAEAKAQPVAVATKRLEARVGDAGVRLDKIESATTPQAISVSFEQPKPAE